MIQSPLLVKSPAAAYVFGMRLILLAALSLMTSPAVAAGTCFYVSDEGDQLTFATDGQNTVTIANSDGTRADCTWAVTPDGPSYFGIACADGTKSPFFFGPSKPHGTDQGLLAYRNEIWYRQCGPGM